MMNSDGDMMESQSSMEEEEEEEEEISYKSKSRKRNQEVSSSKDKRLSKNSLDKQLQMILEQLRAPFQENLDIEKKKTSGFFSIRKIPKDSEYKNNAALYRMAKRFDFYTESKPTMDFTGLKKVFKHVCTYVKDEDVRKTYQLMDTDHDGLISFPEFVSFFSLTTKQLTQILSRLRTQLQEIFRKGAWKDKVGKLIMKGTNKINQRAFSLFIEQILGMSLTSGELTMVRDRIGLTYTTLKEFVKGETEIKYSDPLPLTRITISKTTKMSEIPVGWEHIGPIGRQRILLIQRKNAKDTSVAVKTNPKRVQKLDDEAESSNSESEQDSEETDSEVSSLDSDSDQSVEKSDSEKEKENEKDNSSKRHQRYITNIDICRSNKDAGMVADGFQCITQRIAKNKYLWYRTDKPVEYGTNVFLDDIVDIQIALGKVNDRSSPMYSPPSHGYKCFRETFPIGKKGTVAAIWYLKLDTTYARETPLIRDNTMESEADKQSLEIRLKVAIRERLSETCLQRRERYFEPTKLVPRKHEYMSKKQFIKFFDRLGLNLSASDLAFLFQRFDVGERHKVHRDDVIEFLELSDTQLDSILLALRDRFKSGKFQDMTESEVFRELDFDQDGKLVREDIHVVLVEMGVVVSPQELIRLADLLDLNASGYIELAEFKTFLRTDRVSWRATESRVSTEIRELIRTFHALILDLARNNHHSGKVSGGNDAKYAFRYLLKLQEQRLKRQSVAAERDPDGIRYLMGETIKHFLELHDHEVKMQHVREMIAELEGSKNAKRDDTLSYAVFENFLNNFSPAAQQTHMLLPAARARAHSTSESLRQLRSFLAAISKRFGNRVDMMLEKIVRKPGVEKASLSQVARGLKQMGFVFHEDHARGVSLEGLLAVIDRNRSGYITVNDLGIFLFESARHRRNSGDPASDSDHDYSNLEWSDSGSDDDNHGHLSQSRRELLTSRLKSHDRKDRKSHPEISNSIKRDFRRYLNQANNQFIRADHFVNLNSIQAYIEEAVRIHGKPLELRKRFEQMGSNGTIALDSFRRILHKTSVRIPSPEMKTLEQMLSVDESGVMVNFEKFLSIVESSSEIEASNFANMHSRLLRLFDGTDWLSVLENFDSKGRGSISMEHFKEVLKLLDIRVLPADWNTLISLIATPDGMVDYRTLQSLLWSKPWGATTILEDARDSLQMKQFQHHLFNRIGEAMQAKSHNFELSFLFENHDEYGNGYILEETFRSTLGDFLTKSGISISKPQVDSVIQPFRSRNKSTGVYWIDYLGFCEAFGNHTVIDEEMLLQRVSNMFHHSMTSASVPDIKEIFNMYDHEGRGFLSRYDFRRVLLQQLHISLNEQELEFLMNMFDTEFNGFVDYIQLLNAVTPDMVVEADKSEQSEMANFIIDELEYRSRRDIYFDARKLWGYFLGDGAHIMSRESFEKLVRYLGYSARRNQIPMGSTIQHIYDHIVERETDWDEICCRVWEYVSHKNVVNIMRTFQMFEQSRDSVKTLALDEIVKLSGLPLSDENLKLIRIRFSDQGQFQYRIFFEFVQARACFCIE